MDTASSTIWAPGARNSAVCAWRRRARHRHCARVHRRHCSIERVSKFRLARASYADAAATVTFSYGLDDLVFAEVFALPARRIRRRARARSTDCSRCWARRRRQLLQGGGATPFEIEPPLPPAAAALLDAVLTQGLGEFAYATISPRPPPVLPRADSRPALRPPWPRAPASWCRSAEARTRRWRSRSSGARGSSWRCSRSATRPRSRARWRPRGCRACSRRARSTPADRAEPAGALNGHVPITAIVSCAALLTAALNGFDAVAMANERSASAGNMMWDGVEVNHQFSKGLRAERLLRAALAEAAPDVGLFSVLRPASELAIARAFARMERYHPAFTSCNAIFRIDPALRAARGAATAPSAASCSWRSRRSRRPSAARDLRRGPARRRAAVRGLCAADRDGRPQAVRVRGRGARRASRRSGCSRATRAGAGTRGAAAGGRGAAAVRRPTRRTPTRCSRSATDTRCRRR